MKKLPVLLLLLGFAAPAFALPHPVAASFARGAQFEVAGYDASKSALSDFPVLVRIANDSPSGFAYSQLQSPSTGADLCFIDMAGNGLPFEIDTWDPDGTSLVWVKLPTMEHGTQFVMCWGGATSGKAVCGDNPFAGYKGVWHMNEKNVVDSSGSGNNGTAAGNADVAAGRIGSALSLPNKTDYVTCGQNQSNAELKDGFTVEAWANLANLSGNHCIFGKNLFISFRTSGNNQIQVTTPGKKDHNMGATVPAAGTWWHVVLTFQKKTGNGCKVYVNGALAVQTGADDIQDQSNATEMWLGRNQWGNDQNFQGLLDEMRLSAGIKSADWIYATYAAQNDAAFVTAGAATAYEASAEPQVGVAATDVQYTNATLAVSIASLGMDAAMTSDASWLDAMVLVATDDAFANTVFANPLDRTNEVPASVSVTVVPLVTNTVYWAKVVATNSFDVGTESGAVSFTTRNPQPPAGSILFHSRGFTTLVASGTVSGFGTGSASATARVEASTTSDFATVAAASAESAATLGASADYTVPGLAPDTSYYLRLRIVNEWGLATYVPLDGSYPTRDVPIAATGIGYVFASDGSTVDFTFGVTEVYDGASGTATLVYDGRTLEEKAFSAAGTLSWSGVAAASGTKTATVTVTADAGGATYTKTWSLPVTPGSAAVSVTSVSDHLSSATAVRLHVGDVATLPELAGAASYKAMNGRFCSLDGNVLVATEPGIVGVQCVDTAFNTNTLAVIVLPEAVGSGSVYVYKETVATGDRIWTTAAAWDKVGAESNDSWPKNADDIAVIPFYQFGANDKYLRLKEDITVGGLYYGSFRDTGNDKLVIERHSTVTLKTVHFERTDGEPAIVKICANTTGSRQNQIVFGGYPHHTEYRSDTVLDAGWDGSDNANCRGRFSSSANTNTIPAGVTVSVVNFDRTGNSMGATMWPGHLKGTGIFWNRSSATMRWDGGLAKFTGTIRDSGGYKNDSNDRSGPIYFRTPLCTNVAVEVIGQVARNGGSPRTDWGWEGVGALKVGWNHGYGSEPKHPGTNWFPRAVLLHGGTLVRHPNQNGSWGTNVADLRHTGRLTVEGGLNNITGHGSDNAINWLEADEFVHGDKATVRVVDESRWSLASTATKIKEVTILHGVSAYLVGAAGDPEASDVYPIVPWMVSPITNEDDWDRYPFFACFDENDRLIRPAYNNTALDGAASDKSNAYVWDRTVQIANDVTLNSLYLNNGNKNKYLGEGRKLTLTSGGLVLHNANSAIGLPGRTDNGSLVLGDATHPGYVFAKSGSASQPNQIWAAVTAPGGFVAAYTGYLTLGGDQTGIADEIAVNAGTLALGDADHACSLAKDLPVRVYANATLSVPNAASLNGAILRMDGAAGWFGKVEIPSGVAAKCKKAYWRDYPETPEWQSLPRGVYGSSESAAQFVRDDLFSGQGTLQIVADDCTAATMVLIY